MAYNKFTYKNVGEKLGLTVKAENNIWKSVPKVSYRPLLTELITPSVNFPLITEMARREWIIGSIFRELIYLTEGKITVWSGETLDAEPALGLTGQTDYLITPGVTTYPMQPPIIAVAEAKKNELLTGVGQCIAEMVGARIYNEKGGTTVNRIFGVVTTGSLWGFMVLEGNEVRMDPREYTLDALEEILGILVYMSKNA